MDPMALAPLSSREQTRRISAATTTARQTIVGLLEPAIATRWVQLVANRQAAPVSPNSKLPMPVMPREAACLEWSRIACRPNIAKGPPPFAQASWRMPRSAPYRRNVEATAVSPWPAHKGTSQPGPLVISSRSAPAPRAPPECANNPGLLLLGKLGTFAQQLVGTQPPIL